MSDTIHLRPTAPLAERVILPGDPGRALALAQALLTEPKMFNHNRGLWGYTGAAPDGEPMTIQSTGMGGPSTAIVLSELAQLGARTVVRAGTCGALHPSLELGQLLVVTDALAADGASRALGAGDRVAADRRLADALLAAAGAGGRSGTVVSCDLFYDNPAGFERGVQADGALAVEMEAATVFALAARRGLRAGCALIVSDVLLPQRRRIGDESLREAELALGRLVLAAISGPQDAGAGAALAASGRAVGAPRYAAGGTRRVRGLGRDASKRSSAASIEARRASRPPSASPCGRRSSSRSSASSIASSRWETLRTRRVSRSRSAADGRLSADIASSWARTARSRVPNAAETAEDTTRCSSRSCASRPIASSP